MRTNQNELEESIVNRLKMKNGNFKKGQWYLLKPSDVKDAITELEGSHSENSLENELFDILDKTGGAKDIRELWGKYFSNSESERNKIAKIDAINDLVNYFLEK